MRATHAEETFDGTWNDTHKRTPKVVRTPNAQKNSTGTKTTHIETFDGTERERHAEENFDCTQSVRALGKQELDRSENVTLTTDLRRHRERHTHKRTSAPRTRYASRTTNAQESVCTENEICIESDKRTRGLGRRCERYTLKRTSTAPSTTHAKKNLAVLRTICAKENFDGIWNGTYKRTPKVARTANTQKSSTATKSTHISYTRDL
ncbi:hypothetical protein PoB_002706200 [Plakobranchus ocellatus]|uniref:Uncharacterized protein n=1 Tax=Plakobranchus ocellatus TaxID=259542 RepID=A0AAV4A0Z4_9GAST|nr:hypothetical protein PoB_002706200 [Plakobranchus ocellatus]